jgi:hypothetical protein
LLSAPSWRELMVFDISVRHSTARPSCLPAGRGRAGVRREARS